MKTIVVDPGVGLTPVTVEANDQQDAVNKAMAHYQATIPDNPIVKVMTAIAKHRAEVGSRALRDDEVMTTTRACLKETSAGVQPAQVIVNNTVEGEN